MRMMSSNEQEVKVSGMEIGVEIVTLEQKICSPERDMTLAQ